jgi:tetratricopeptide (TPR) repeat protein
MPARIGQFPQCFRGGSPRVVRCCPVLAHLPQFFVFVRQVCQNQYSSRVRVRASAIVTLGAAAIALVLGHGANASTRQTETPYLQAIDLYRRGQDELALKRFATVMASDAIRERDALFAALESKWRGDSERAAATIRGAVMLHTARAFAALATHNNGEFRYHLLFARTLADKLASRNRREPFVRTWPLMVLAFLHEGRMVLAANEFSRHFHDPGGDSPELLFAMGATEEMAWWIHHEEDADPGVKGDLKDAERHYRQVLILSPTFAEARLRLGRVLALRDDPEAIKVLAQIGESAQSPYRYLARLFEGDLIEKRGDTAAAERLYSEAVSLVPTAQSAYMALAHVRHARGARAEAAQAVRSSAGATDVADTADPWFWYSRGTAWRGPGYFGDLRKMIAP